MSFRRFLKATGARSMSSRQDDEEEESSEVTVNDDTDRPDIVWDRLKVRSSFVQKTVDRLDAETPKPKDHTRFVCISDTHHCINRMRHPVPDGDVLIHSGDFTNVGRIHEVKRFNDFLGQTRFVCISDTFSRTNRMPNVPDGDILIHAGNFSNLALPSEVKAFDEFLGTLPHKHKIVIAGNHEVTFDRQLMTEQNSHVFMSFATAFNDLKEHEWKDIRSLLTHCVYLEDAEVNILGFRIYGSPWTPAFCDWGFNLARGQALLDKWNKIPEGIDILVTHGPPVGHGDLTTDHKRVGCVELLSTIQKRVKPKYHIYGHIHEGYGITTDDTTTFVNASICTAHYQPTNPPIVFDLPTPKIPAMEAETSV